MPPSWPIFVIPNIYRSNEHFLSVLKRFDLYGESFHKANEGGGKLLIFIGMKKRDFELCVAEEFGSIVLYRISKPTNNSIVFGIKCLIKLQSLKVKRATLVASNLYFGFLSCLVVRILSPRKIKIQVSVHGSVIRPGDGPLIERLRRSYLKFLFARADSIRTVSDFLRQDLSQSFRIPGVKLFVAPIPVDIPIVDLPKENSKVIAFVGRMHAERGVDEWAEIIASLYSQRDDFSIYLIGSGPQELVLKSRLESISPHLLVSSFGYLDRKELQKKWGQIQVFFSSAPSEGYGLSIREALTTATFVCARESEGSEIVSLQFPEVVKTYRSRDEAVRILNEMLERTFPIQIALNFTRELRDLNTDYVHSLVETWA